MKVAGNTWLLACASISAPSLWSILKGILSLTYYQTHRYCNFSKQYLNLGHCCHLKPMERDTSSHSELGQALQRRVKKVVGIKMLLKNQSWEDRDIA